MKVMSGSRTTSQLQGEMPFSIERANAQRRLRAALEDSARDPLQMASALCARITQAGNGTHTLDLTALDEDETACVLRMRPEAWRALSDVAHAAGGAHLQSAILGAGFVFDETTVRGLAELPALANLTLQPGQRIDETLLLQVRRFETVKVTQLPPAGEAAPGEPVPLATPVDDAQPPVLEATAAACDLLAAALADPQCKPVDVPDALNWLLEEAPQVSPSHVDRLLVGFLKEAIQSGRGELITHYVNTIFDSTPLKHDPHRRLALLMGLALPISPEHWTPNGGEVAGGAFGISNSAAADTHRVASTYRGPPLLFRICKEVRRRSEFEPLPPQQLAIYHGFCALFGSVLASKELTSHERRTFCTSTFAGSKSGSLTSCRFAIERGNLGMAAAILQMVNHADLPEGHKTELLDSLGVELDELLEHLLALKYLSDTAWVDDMLSWIEPAYARRIGIA